MKNSPPITQDTRLNTANAYSEERELKRSVVDKLTKLEADIKVEKMIAQENGMTHPIVEAPRDVIEYLNRGVIKQFDAAGYCISDGVLVCEEGKREEILDKVEAHSRIEPSVLAKQLYDIKQEAKAKK